MTTIDWQNPPDWLKDCGPDLGNVIAFRSAVHAKQLKLFNIVRGDSPKRWQAIREIYRLQKLMIGDGYEAYPVDWCSIMTPIEYSCWCAMRRLGALPFNFQFQIGRFFVDFADPVQQLVIECDGKRWHDAHKDAARDAELSGLGWTVIRFTGARCFMGEDNQNSAHVELAALAESYRQEVRPEQDDE